MLSFTRRNRSPESLDPGKSLLKPAIYEPPGSVANRAAGPAPRASLEPSGSIPDGGIAPAPVPRVATAPTAAAATGIAFPEPRAAEGPGSKLFVGVNIKLKGVEVSDCDVLVIEGHVEATVHSKAMQIAKPGTLHGTALIDVAEVLGEFSGELTARTRLVVQGTGRVSGTIRYGKLIVAEGGELSGDVKRLDDSDEQPRPSSIPASH
jgi:cytoskeletal protein CcmA (bactofilin family)